MPDEQSTPPRGAFALTPRGVFYDTLVSAGINIIPVQERALPPLTAPARPAMHLRRDVPKALRKRSASNG